MTIDEYIIKKVEHIAPAYAEKPENAEGEYLVVDLISVSSQNYLNSATVAIRSYADSMADASDLNAAVMSYMNDFWTDPKIARCKIDTSYQINNPSVAQYKWQCIYNITHYLD